MDLCLYAVIGGLVMGPIAALVAFPKGRAGWGFLAGFMLGPLGVLVAALMKPSPEVEERQLRERLAMEARIRKDLGLPGGADVQLPSTKPPTVEEGDAVEEGAMGDPASNEQRPVLLALGGILVVVTLLCFMGAQ